MSLILARKRPGIEWLRGLGAGKVVGADDLLGGQSPTPPPKRGQTKKKEPEEKANLGLLILGICQEHQLEYKTEYQFHEVRKWRFDYAIPALNIAIEYEGINSDKSGHTTLVGYTKDCDKYNAAVLNGWKLLRYTAKNYGNVVSELKELINQIKPIKNETKIF